MINKIHLLIIDTLFIYNVLIFSHDSKTLNMKLIKKKKTLNMKNTTPAIR